MSRARARARQGEGEERQARFAESAGIMPAELPLLRVASSALGGGENEVPWLSTRLDVSGV